MEGRSEVWYTADLILLPRQHSSEATSSHFMSSSDPGGPRRPREAARACPVLSELWLTATLSTSRACLVTLRLERDEGDLDLRRERRGGRWGAGWGDGEGGARLDAVLLTTLIFSLLSLPLHLSLFWPEDKQASIKNKKNNQKATGGVGKTCKSTANMLGKLVCRQEIWNLRSLSWHVQLWSLSVAVLSVLYDSFLQYT